MEWLQNIKYAVTVVKPLRAIHEWLIAMKEKGDILVSKDMVEAIDDYIGLESFQKALADKDCSSCTSDRLMRSIKDMKTPNVVMLGFSWMHAKIYSDGFGKLYTKLNIIIENYKYGRRS